MSLKTIEMDGMNVKCEHHADNKLKWGHRHLQALMMFGCLVTAYSIRSSMGVALVAMSPKRNNPMQNLTTILNGSLEINTTLNDNMMPYTEVPTFSWDKKTQEMIQSCFFWGYMLLQLPAGALAHRFGAKFLLVVAVLGNAVVSLAIPWAAIHGGAVWMMVCRLIQGLTQACVVPSLHTLLGKWSPLQERGRISAFVHGGSALGTVMGLNIAGYLAASSHGWPGIFQFYGSLAAIVGGVWAVFGAESPAHHKKISEEERIYIQLGLGQKNVSKKQKHLPVPWRKILSHRGLWAIVVAHISTSWGQITLYSQIPSYMSHVMGVGIGAVGTLTAIPFLVMWFTNFFFSWMADYVTNKGILGITATRKVFNTIGCWPAAVGMLILGFVPPEDLILTEAVLIFVCGVKVASHLGFQVNQIDISPNFAGTIMSISNFVSNAIASFSPMCAAYFLTDVTDQHLWRYVFYASAALYFTTNLVYLALGTAELAAWNDGDLPEAEDCIEDRKRDEKEETVV